MGKLKLILTADYEVFGNGSGCVKKCMVEPTIRMLDICDKYGAKLTLFVDVCEYWAFKKKLPNNQNGGRRFSMLYYSHTKYVI